MHFARGTPQERLPWDRGKDVSDPQRGWPEDWRFSKVA